MRLSRQILVLTGCMLVALAPFAAQGQTIFDGYE